MLLVYASYKLWQPNWALTVTIPFSTSFTFRCPIKKGNHPHGARQLLSVFLLFPQSIVGSVEMWRWFIFTQARALCVTMSFRHFIRACLVKKNHCQKRSFEEQKCFFCNYSVSISETIYQTASQTINNFYFSFL